MSLSYLHDWGFVMSLVVNGNSIRLIIPNQESSSSGHKPGLRWTTSFAHRNRRHWVAIFSDCEQLLHVGHRQCA